MRTIIEPFRAKVVEPIRMTSQQEREDILRSCHYNLFAVRAEDVLIDLLTDSGTSAMSSEQWAAMMRGDESYAGARSYFRFEATIRELTGYKEIIPTHQGRAAERILFSAMLRPGAAVPNNNHFDTTRANVEQLGAEALDFPCAEGKQLFAEHPFKGNIDVRALESWLNANPSRHVPLMMATVTNNSGGGQPMSLANLREVSALAKRFGVPLYLDACRFAENAYLIKLREEGQAHRSVREIASEMFSLADGCTMSAKKDGLANIGGFVATNDPELADQMRNHLILTEGFPTYGGMAGRDLDAIAVGLHEVLDEDYLAYRVASARYLGRRLDEIGIPYVKPVGAHAVYIDARGFFPHVPPLEYPGQALVVELYREGGIRSCDLGGTMFGRRDALTGSEKAVSHDLVRLALPRRVYTQSHVDYVVEVMEQVWARRQSVAGVRFVWQAPFLRHFTARYAPVR